MTPSITQSFTRHFLPSDLSRDLVPQKVARTAGIPDNLPSMFPVTKVTKSAAGVLIIALCGNSPNEFFIVFRSGFVGASGSVWAVQYILCEIFHHHHRCSHRFRRGRQHYRHQGFMLIYN